VGLVQSLLPRLEEKMDLHRRLKSDVITHRAWIIFLGLTAMIAIGLTGFVIVRRLHKQARLRRPATAYFPSVSVESRFGGGFGGGAMAEIAFGPDTSSRSAKM
jgi:hypothetical protein